MSQAEQIFDGLIGAFARMGAQDHLADMVAEARATDRRECGNCDLWMKKGPCPRERGTMVGGPSMGTPACEKFNLKDWVAKLKVERIAKAQAFAAERHLPIPTI